MKTEDIRKLLDADRLLLGRDVSVKALRSGAAVQLLVAANAQPLDVDTLRGYADLVGAEVVLLGVDNHQLGTVCRKPFPVSFVVVKRA